jgi:hypothetical protein
VDYQIMMAQRAKIVEPEPYHGKNLAELRTFRRVCERAFDYKPLAFPVKREKVSWAAMYLRDTPATEWARYRKDGGSVDIEWDAFITFLTDILMESGNRQRYYTLKYENAKQRPGQSIRAFVEYLESCEEELEPYTETQRAEHLLAKILPEMRQRLVEGGYTRTKLSRTDLISVIAMLEQNQSPTSKGTKTDSKDKDKSESSSNKKKGSWKNKRRNRDQNQDDDGKGNSTSQDATSSSASQTQRNTGGSTKDKPRDKSKDTCNRCGQKGHWANECPDRDKEKSK